MLEKNCSFIFTLQNGESRNNCYFGNFERDKKKSRYSSYYNYDDDYYYTPTKPKPNQYGFKPSTLVHLATKGETNLTETLITKFGLKPQRNTEPSNYGYCQGTGIHVIKSKQPWKLTINLVYIKNRGWSTPQGCTFKIFKMVSGALKLSIPNFTVSTYSN